MLKASQVELGNIIVAENHKGDVVSRRLVGGKFGSVTKYFMIDIEGNLKSNARATIEEVLDGYAIELIANEDFSASGRTYIDANDLDELEFTFRKGDILVAYVDDELVYRQIVGGKQFDTKAWFTIDPATGKRTSKTTYNNLDEVVEAYEFIAVLR